MATSEGVESTPGLGGILADTERLGFAMSSMADLGPLLRVLAASKPEGRLLELGTGTGISTAWLLAGMDAGARLLTVENDPVVLDVAERHLGGDERVAFRLEDGVRFLQSWTGEQFDLVFADTWPGKFNELDLALSLVATGGMYVVDDLLPQPSWPPEHGAKVNSLVRDLRSREGFVAVQMSWSSGIMVLVRTHAA